MGPASPSESNDYPPPDPPDSLGPGQPKFQLWHIDEISEVWRAQPDEEQFRVAARNYDMDPSELVAGTCLELPDTPWGRAYRM